MYMVQLKKYLGLFMKNILEITAFKARLVVQGFMQVYGLEYDYTSKFISL